MAEKKPNEKINAEFVSLDEDDMDFTNAQKKIEMLEAYEYYLSEACPVSNMLNNAISEYPNLEPVFQMLLTGIMNEIETEWTPKEILECALKLIRREIPDSGSC